MALNIKDPATERLATEVAALAGESKTRAVRVALEQRRERLVAGQHGRHGELQRFLENEAWPQVPEGVLGCPVSREERELILGYGLEGA